MLLMGREENEQPLTGVNIVFQYLKTVRFFKQ